MNRLCFAVASGFSLILASSVEAECYFNTSRYWAITSAFDVEDDISHDEFIERENLHGRYVDGVVVNNELFPLLDEHPIEVVKYTQGYC